MSRMTPEKTKKLKIELFKSSAISAAFSLFSRRKKEARARGEKFLLQDMAERAGVDKSQASRWFGGGDAPNMQLSTLYAIGDALDGDVRIEFVDRKTGDVHTAHGVEAPKYSYAATSKNVVGHLIVAVPDRAILTVGRRCCADDLWLAGCSFSVSTTVKPAHSHDFDIVFDRGRVHAA